MITTIILCIVSFVAGIFVYRNNVKTIDPVAGKIDEIAEKVKEKLDKE